MKGFVLSLVAVCALAFAGRSAEAQQCNVQQNQASSVSSAAAIQQQAALLQLQSQLNQLNAQRAAAVSSAVAPQQSRFFVQVPGAVQSVQSFAAPAAIQVPTAGAQAFASSGVAVPAPVQTFNLSQLSTLLAPASSTVAVGAGGGGGCNVGRSRAVSRTVSGAVQALRPARNTSRSRSVSVSRSG